MSDFTVKTVISDIAKALSDTFPETMIYTEQVKQGLKLPCFFIQCVSDTMKPYPSGRFCRKLGIAVQYLPADELNPAEECFGISEQLYSCLRLIGNEGNYTRGLNLSQEYSAEVLSFYVDYVSFVRSDTDTADDNQMDGIEGSISTKGG